MEMIRSGAPSSMKVERSQLSSSGAGTKVGPSKFSGRSWPPVARAVSTVKVRETA
jgi:hypothetical protein